MNEEYRAAQPEGKSGYQQLKEKKTIGEILEAAMSFEHSAREFYRALATHVAKPIRLLVEELAEEEALHYQLFQAIAKRPDVQAHAANLIKTPPSDYRFSDYVSLPELGDFPDAQAILQYALGREQVAMEQYSTLAEESPPGPIRDLFLFLAAEELKHKGELEKRYYAVVGASRL
jgi:rubrerythrin